MQAYISDALTGQTKGHMLPWAVRDVASGTILGSTRYHDIVRDIDRVEIGYTWYRQSAQRSHVNTTCKLLLLTHGFEELGCKVIGLRMTTSTSSRSGRSRPSARRRTASSDITHRGATAACATR